MNVFTPFLILLATGMTVSYCLLWLLAHSPLVKYFGDAPDHRKVHQSIIPRLGGLGIILAFMLMLTGLHLALVPGLPALDSHTKIAMAFTCVFLMVSGTLDDVKGVGFKLKFLMQFILATAVVFILGYHLETVSILGRTFQIGWFGAVISVFWIVAVMNAFNIIDGIDGLAVSVAVCGICAIGYASYSNGGFAITAICVCLVGLTTAFLRFNFSRSRKMFLGDTGSQFLGAMLAILALIVQGQPHSGFSVIVPLLIVGYPLLDITVAMVRRFVKTGPRSITTRFLRMFAADNEHLHHRLVYLGMSHLQSTFLLTMVAFGMAATAIAMMHLTTATRIPLLAYLMVALFLILNRLGYIGLRPWVVFPRGQTLPERIVGVIEPDDVFFHSLKSFKQNQFQFLSLPGKLTKFMGDDLIAVMLYNAGSECFEERWTMALRASEYQDCPAIIIADESDIENVKAMNPDGFKSIRFMQKPVRVPDLIRELESFTHARAKKRIAVHERKFSLAELALRKNA